MTIFDHAWRTKHAEAGDRALGTADSVLDEMENSVLDEMEKRSGRGAADETYTAIGQIAAAYAAIAQAHYAAANVRAKPGVVPEPSLPEAGKVWTVSQGERGEGDTAQAVFTSLVSAMAWVDRTWPEHTPWEVTAKDGSRLCTLAPGNAVDKLYVTLLPLNPRES